jgi:splicing factor 3A subunit 3
LTGKKHIRAAEARKAAGDSGAGAPPSVGGGVTSVAHRLKERAVAEREHRVRSLVKVLDPERQATRINVERRQGMTERERQMELEALMAEFENAGGPGRNDQSDDEGDERIYNPLKLPLAWDGKPIPYWLYKLHGLGVEYPCEICGNFVYMGRRAFDKHFSEALHIFGLKCLGITSNTNLFREITRIEDAIKLWEKLEQDRKKERESRDNVVQMEDAEGNVMPERIYLDLQKQGIL